MQLSLFILPMLRIMRPQTGLESCLQLLWSIIIVKDDGGKSEELS